MDDQPDTNGTETLEKSLANPDVAETLDNPDVAETLDNPDVAETLDNTEECVDGSQDEIVETGDISGSQEPLANPAVAKTLDNTEECVDGSQDETVETGDQEHDGSIDEILNSIDFIEDADDHETDERETKTLGEKNDVSLNNKAPAKKDGTQSEKETEEIEQLQSKINDENKNSKTQTTDIVRKTPINEDETETNKNETESNEETQANSKLKTKTKTKESTEKNQIQTNKVETPAQSVMPQVNKAEVYPNSLRLVGIPNGTPPMYVRNFIQRVTGFKHYCWIVPNKDQDEFIANFNTPEEATQVLKRLQRSKGGSAYKGNSVKTFYNRETEESTDKKNNKANASQVSADIKAVKRLRPDDDGTSALDVDVEPKKFKVAEATTNSHKNVTTPVAKQASATQEKSINPFAGKRVFWKPRDVYYDHTFGLSKSFLDGLNIRLPLLRRVVVKNINQNITEEHYGYLRNIFSLAGFVTDINIFTLAKLHKLLMVEYDHPVEAVQAISMFNKQVICGHEVTVEPDYKYKGKYYPLGLASLGPGLGAEGRPLTFVRHHVESQPIKQALQGLKQQINAADQVAKGVFDYPEHKQPDEQQQQQLMNTSEINQFNAQSNAVNANQVQQGNGMTPQNMNPQNLMLSLMHSQMAQGGAMSNEMAVLQAQYMTMAQNMGLVPMMVPNTSTMQMQNAAMDQNMPSAGQAPSMFVPNAPIQPAPSGMGRNSGFSGNQHHNPGMSDWKGNQSSHYKSQQQNQYGSGAPKSQTHFSSAPVSYKSPLQVKEEVFPRHHEEYPKNSDTLVFSFLPPCVTSQALTIKMNEVGKVLFCELAGPGRALVRFKHSGDAERCIQLFHKSKVDGQVIHVKFL